MNAPLQLAMGIEVPHRNQSLFSDHYLNTLLPADPRWEEALPEAEAFLAWLQELYSREQDHLADYNESQLEEHWFRPILTRLGHVFEPQAAVPGLDRRIKHPDYVFFPGEAARQSAVSAQKTDDYAAQALAVGEVKGWDVPLGKRQKGGGASFDAQNPSFQIDYYLRASGLKWGILSNGRLWRLVHADSSYRLSVYYEVDLVDLLSRADAVHDLLAYLAQQMMEMNKRKQAAVEAFWLDLEGVTEAAAFEKLRHKGKQEATLWKRAEACRPFVGEESRATRSLEDSLGWSQEAFKAFVKALAGGVEDLSKLVQVYQAHSPAYQELVARLEATDRLIDRIVYRLYGLTEEEISVVEAE